MVKTWKIRVVKRFETAIFDFIELEVKTCPNIFDYT